MPPNRYFWPAHLRLLAKCFAFSFLALSAVGNTGCGSAAPGTIGAALGQRSDRRVFLRAVPVGEGADRAGLRIDDEVIALNGRDVTGMSPDEIRRAVRGDVGTTLTVTILRDGARQEVKVTRTPLSAKPPP